MYEDFSKSFYGNKSWDIPAHVDGVGAAYADLNKDVPGKPGLGWNPKSPFEQGPINEGGSMYSHDYAGGPAARRVMDVAGKMGFKRKPSIGEIAQGTMDALGAGARKAIIAGDALSKVKNPISRKADAMASGTIPESKTGKNWRRIYKSDTITPSVHDLYGTVDMAALKKAEDDDYASVQHKENRQGIGPDPAPWAKRPVSAGQKDPGLEIPPPGQPTIGEAYPNYEEGFAQQEEQATLPPEQEPEYEEDPEMEQEAPFSQQPQQQYPDVSDRLYEAQDVAQAMRENAQPSDNEEWGDMGKSLYAVADELDELSKGPITTIALKAAKPVVKNVAKKAAKLLTKKGLKRGAKIAAAFGGPVLETFIDSPAENLARIAVGQMDRAGQAAGDYIKKKSPAVKRAMESPVGKAASEAIGKEIRRGQRKVIAGGSLYDDIGSQLAPYKWELTDPLHLPKYAPEKWHDPEQMGPAMKEVKIAINKGKKLLSGNKSQEAVTALAEANRAITSAILGG